MKRLSHISIIAFIFLALGQSTVSATESEWNRYTTTDKLTGKKNEPFLEYRSKIPDTPKGELTLKVECIDATPPFIKNDPTAKVTYTISTFDAPVLKTNVQVENVRLSNFRELLDDNSVSSRQYISSEWNNVFTTELNFLLKNYDKTLFPKKQEIVLANGQIMIVEFGKKFSDYILLCSVGIRKKHNEMRANVEPKNSPAARAPQEERSFGSPNLTNISLVNTKETINKATADFSNDRLDLQVYKTSWAAVKKDLGNISGNLKISFDWAITAEGWWEGVGLGVVTNGTPNFNLSKCKLSQNNGACGTVIASPNEGGLPVQAFQKTTGQFEKNISVNGYTTLVFFITPSDHSENSDHGRTALSVTNFRITRN